MGAGTRGGCKAGRPPRSRDFLPTITLGAAKTGTRFEPAPPHEQQANQQKGTPMDNQTRTKDDIEIETATWDIRRRILDNTINVIADIAKTRDTNLTDQACAALAAVNRLRGRIDIELEMLDDEAMEMEEKEDE